MKRVIFCIIGWVLVLGLHAQIVENMRIYTDKDCYVAGEKTFQRKQTNTWQETT